MTDISSAIPDFSAKDAERLKAFLAAPERPEGTMRYGELTGFLFTLCCAPELIRPSEWMALIFAEQDPGYATLDEASEVLRSLMTLYNHINDQVREAPVALPEGCVPHADALANLEPEAPLSQWARGVVGGHNWLSELWDAYVPDELGEELAGTLMVLTFFSSRSLAQGYLSEVTRKNPTLEEFAADMLRLFPAAIESYAHLGLSIQQVLNEPPPEPARSEKVPRNAPCPCGSGKKYKKCCGVN